MATAAEAADVVYYVYDIITKSPTPWEHAAQYLDLLAVGRSVIPAARRLGKCVLILYACKYVRFSYDVV